MHKLLIALMLVSGGALADPPRYTTEQNQYGRTVAGSSCAGGYCAQYDRTGRTVGNSSYTQDRAPEVNQQIPSIQVETRNSTYTDLVPPSSWTGEVKQNPKGWKTCIGGADVCTPAVLAKMNKENRELIK